MSGVFQVDVASRWSRLGAVLLDELIVTTIVIILVLAGVIKSTSFLSDKASFPQVVLFVILYLAVYAVVNGHMLATRGQSIGKRIFKIRIVNVDGSQTPVSRLLFLRLGLPLMICAVPYVGSVFGLLDSIYILNPQRQCLHDVIANTRVIRVVG